MKNLSLLYKYFTFRHYCQSVLSTFRNAAPESLTPLRGSLLLGLTQLKSFLSFSNRCSASHCFKCKKRKQVLFARSRLYGEWSKSFHRIFRIFFLIKAMVRGRQITVYRIIDFGSHFSVDWWAFRIICQL